VIGPVSGSNTMTKVGEGTLVLSGTNVFSGRTTISNGVLKVVGNGLVTNTPSIDIASGATLDVSGRTGGSLTLVSGQRLQGSGTVGGKLIVGDGATLSPGGSVGTLTFLNDLVVSNAAALEYDLGTTSDLIAVSSNLTLDGTLNITDAGGFGAGVYTLFTYGGALVDNGMTFGAVPIGYAYRLDTNTAGQVRLDVTTGATVAVIAADLQDRLGNLMSADGVAVLVADTGNNGFADPQPDCLLDVGVTWGNDDKVVGLWDLRDSLNCSDHDHGVLCAEMVVSYVGGVAAGQSVQLYWFPSLTLASNTVGVTDYGKYADTNSPPLDNSDSWNLPVPENSVLLRFATQSEGGSNPDAAGRATLSTATLPVARFMATPVTAAEPLTVTYTDTSSGLTPLNLTWNLGDSFVTNTAGGASFVHAYPAGTYTVILTASNSLGVSTLISNNLLTVLTALQAWQLQYFGCTNPVICPQAAAAADPDGDGLSNANELLLGTDPTNNASAFRIIAVAREGIDLRVTWSMGAGKTNALQAAAGGGSVTSDFADVFNVTNTIGDTTNHVDVGAATNSPSRYYRVRLVP
jgi:autotransporter-associated beta strand protein